MATTVKTTSVYIDIEKSPRATLWHVKVHGASPPGDRNLILTRLEMISLATALLTEVVKFDKYTEDARIDRMNETLAQQVKEASHG